MDLTFGLRPKFYILSASRDNTAFFLFSASLSGYNTDHQAGNLKEMLGCLSCGKRLALDIYASFCPVCREPLLITRSEDDGPRAFHTEGDSSLEKFRDFLPLETIDPSLSLGEGNSPLVRLRRLESELGGFNLFSKDETQNPTGSFKDRGTIVAVHKARLLGFKKIGTVSTGNMAASTAAYGARAGLETFVLLKEGTSKTSLLSAGIFGPTLVTVQGDYGRLFHRSLEIGRELGIYFMNSIDPFRLEGYKVTGFEMYFQLGKSAPDFIFVPLSSGGHLIGLMRSFEDLEREGLVDRYPTFVGVQAQGCAPLARAFEEGRPKYQRLKKAWTIAHAISNPAPPAGNAALHLIRKHKGIILSVSDEEMLEAQRTLASKEGLFCQPESAASLAGLLKFGKANPFRESATAVLVLTGSGLKAPHALDSLPLKIHQFAIEELAEGLQKLV